ncbi:MAG: hypothetical protein KAY24_03480 [Candidatus Eisenbacteria sp.]|nr:hypothetical protein [Candidatus Eisenbacteria bacterium]
MKKVILLTMTTVLLCGTSCDMQDQVFQFVAHYRHMGPIDFDHTGEYDTGQVVITDNDVKAALDIPSSGEIKSVDVQALALRLQILEGNTAQFVDIEASIVGTAGTFDIFKEYDYTVPLVGVDAPFIGLNSLISTGIAELKRQLEDLVIDEDRTSITVDVKLRPRGIGNRVHVRLHLLVDISVIYEECISVPKEIFDNPVCGGTGS